MKSLPQLDVLERAIHSLGEQLRLNSIQPVPCGLAAGKILAEALVADRDSPAIDVSAMDGFAVRLDEATSQPLAIVGTAAAGEPDQSLSPGTAIRIFTGAPVPRGADTVVQREWTEEKDGLVSLMASASGLFRGQNIRRQGENIRCGQAILPVGTFLSAVRMSVVATFAQPEIKVFRPVRVVILNSGDELIPPGMPVQPWQIRDSNGPVLESLLRQRSWIELVSRETVSDDLSKLVDRLTCWLPKADAILLTGGVSMGDRDYVPQAITEVGGKIVFHRLPIRPGRPILGAIGPAGQLIVGLPGNPVSVAVTARRFALGWLRKLGGLSLEDEAVHLRSLAPSDESKLDLIRYRIVRQLTTGEVELVDARGSGDLVSLGNSHGFIEVPTGESGGGPWPYYPW
jgi:molybdopterin molybdotransferase